LEEARRKITPARYENVFISRKFQRKARFLVYLIVIVEIGKIKISNSPFLNLKNFL